MQQNIKISGNSISGNPTAGNYYDLHVYIDNSTGALFEQNTLSNPKTGASYMMAVESSAMTIKQNKFMRGNVALGSNYIYFITGTLDRSKVFENFFDSSTYNGLSEVLIGENDLGSFTSCRNRNEVYYKYHSFFIHGPDMNYWGSDPYDGGIWARYRSSTTTIINSSAFLDSADSSLSKLAVIRKDLNDLAEPGAKILSFSSLFKPDTGTINSGQNFGLQVAGYYNTQTSNTVALTGAAQWNAAAAAAAVELLITAPVPSTAPPSPTTIVTFIFVGTQIATPVGSGVALKSGPVKVKYTF